MKKIIRVENKEEALELLNTALEHEWAVSFEYIIHAYSMPKGKFFYQDPVMKNLTDIRAQTIQIGIDEMYHALQLGIIISQMGGLPSFRTDEVIRFPKIIENLERDKKTEDLVTALYQEAEFKEKAFPEIENMVWNISYDEVRHSRQFEAMISSLKKNGSDDSLCYQPNPQAEEKKEVQLLHRITRMENELMHRYLKYVMLFSNHQDLSQRLFKNSIDHMRHWDKNAGILIKMGDVIRIEKVKVDKNRVERSTQPMPSSYPGKDRLSTLETLVPAEKTLIEIYEELISLLPAGEIKDQLNLHLGQNREHLFTQEWLLKNARKIKGLH
ncbi:MAG: hypothetical protein ACOC57_06650 [Acidobacteriota bacterium]